MADISIAGISLLLSKQVNHENNTTNKNKMMKRKLLTYPILSFLITLDRLSSSNGTFHSHIVVMLRKIEVRLATRGASDTIKYLKAVKLCLTRYLCDQPLIDSPIPQLAINKRGLPKILGSWMPLIVAKDPQAIRMVLSILSISRWIPSRGVPDYSAITLKAKVPTPQIDLIGEQIHNLCLDMGMSLDKPIYSECHLSTKAGPNAQAMVGAITDLYHLNDKLIDDLEILGGPVLRNQIESLRNNISQSA